MLRRICGFDGKLPFEGTFSNASEFAEQGLADLVHATLVREMYEDLYSVMDTAYNSDVIEMVVTDASKIPIIDPKKPSLSVRANLRISENSIEVQWQPDFFG